VKTKQNKIKQKSEKDCGVSGLLFLLSDKRELLMSCALQPSVSWLL
jgi:hypothetical protein